MLGARQTYRTLSVLAAFALLFSVGAPIVHHVCAMTGEPIAASPANMSHAGEHAEAPCEHTDRHDGGHCVNALHAPSECEMALCFVEAAEPMFAVSADGPSVRLDLVSVRTADPGSPPAFFASSPVRHWVDGTASARERVPVRLLTSTFLL